MASVLLLLGVALASARGTQAGTYAAVDEPRRILTDDEKYARLMEALPWIYWGEWPELLKTYLLIMRTDEVSEYSDYKGWTSLRALRYERAAVASGIGQIATWSGGKGVLCVGPERGGGFLAEVVTRMHQLDSGKVPFTCAGVDKPPADGPPPATYDAWDPYQDDGRGKRVTFRVDNGGVTKPVFSYEGKEIAKQKNYKVQDLSKLKQQEKMLRQIEERWAEDKSKDVVILDTMVSGDSILYHLEAAQELLARNDGMRVAILAVRDGGRRTEGYPESTLHAYGTGEGFGVDPLASEDRDEWGTWFEGNRAHRGGNTGAQWLVRKYPDRFALVITTAWQLVAEDVAAQLVKTPAGANNLFYYEFLDQNGDSVAPIDPRAPDDKHGLYVWKWTPGERETLRGQLVESIADYANVETQLRDARSSSPGELAYWTTTPPPPKGKTLCVFDVDRTLTADQNLKGKDCDGVSKPEGVLDSAYYGTPSPLLQAAYAQRAIDTCRADGMVGIATAATGCEAGNLDGQATKLDWLNKLLRDTDGHHWGTFASGAEKPYLCGCENKGDCVDRIKKYYATQGQPVGKVVFFDDSRANIMSLGHARATVSKQVSCFSGRKRTENCGKTGKCCGITAEEFGDAWRVTRDEIKPCPS